MSLHLIKLGVGVADIGEMAAIQKTRYIDYFGQMVFPVWTRRKPVREKEVLAGGALYRVIKNKIQCRQRIVGLEIVEDDVQGKHCLIMVDPEIIETVKLPHRPFQGWRYFEAAKVPQDIGVFDPAAQDDNIPADMEYALKESGLL